MVVCTVISKAAYCVEACRTMAFAVIVVASLCLCGLSGPAICGEGAPMVPVRVLERIPHDVRAFTQGLFFSGGRLFETTGKHGRSSLRQLDPETGNVLRFVPLAPRYFGEGAVAVGGTVLWLTWTSGKAFMFGVEDLKPRGHFPYRGEGWGLTTDGVRLIMSDGSDVLTFRDPQTFAVIGHLAVSDGGWPVELLNELEWVEGEVYANVWRSTLIAVIDPVKGTVKRWLDLSALVPGDASPEEVANGVAWDPAARRLYVTGKRWPWMFVVESGQSP